MDETPLQRFRRIHRDKGLCVDCTRKALPGQSLCEYHRQKRRLVLVKHYKKPENKVKKRERRLRRNARLLAEGKCSYCLSPLVDGVCVVCDWGVKR